MELTLSATETSELLAVAVENIGLKDIDPSTVEVSVKTLRDGSGGSQLTINCEKYRTQQSPSQSVVAEPENTDDSDTTSTVEPESSDTDESDLDPSATNEGSISGLFE